MKILFLVNIFVIVVCCNVKAEPPNLTGTWIGTYELDSTNYQYNFRNRYKLDIKQSGNELMVLFTAYGSDSLNFRTYYQTASVQADGKSFMLISVAANPLIDAGLTPRMPNIKCNFKTVGKDALLFCESWKDNLYGNGAIFKMKKVSEESYIPFEFQYAFAEKHSNYLLAVNKDSLSQKNNPAVEIETITTHQPYVDAIIFDAGKYDGDFLKMYANNTLLEDSLPITKKATYFRIKIERAEDVLLQILLTNSGSVPGADLFLVLKEDKKTRNYIFSMDSKTNVVFRFKRVQ
jgi:hypothetical protein